MCVQVFPLLLDLILQLGGWYIDLILGEHVVAVPVQDEVVLLVLGEGGRRAEGVLATRGELLQHYLSANLLRRGLF